MWKFEWVTTNIINGAYIFVKEAQPPEYQIP